MNYLFATLGAPGCGKSTFLKGASLEIYGDERLLNYVLSPDNVRQIVSSPEMDINGDLHISQKNESFVWDTINEIIDKKSDKGETIIVDATHSRNFAINNYKKVAEKGYRCFLIDFRDIPLERCLNQNLLRDTIKFVPEDVIETIHDRCLNLETPNWINIISRTDFINNLKTIKMDFSSFENLIFYGDIHGCGNELEYLLKATNYTKDDKNLHIFLGDYFDRGYEKIKTFKILNDLIYNKNTYFIEGNHEVYLRNTREAYMELLEFKDNWIDYIFEKYDNWTTLFNSDYTRDDLNYIAKLKNITINNWDKILPEFSKKFIYGSLVKYVNRQKFSKKNSNSASKTLKEFFLSPEVTFQEITKFYKKLGQLFYGNFKGKEIIATHGGLPTLPDKLTPSFLFCKSVGSYDDTEQVDTIFYEKHPDTINIHGHREPIVDLKLPKLFNINGDVNLGLKAAVISPSENKVIHIEPHEDTYKKYIKNIEMTSKKLNVKKITDEEMHEIFKKNKLINYKKIDDNTAAVNFTPKIFKNKLWNTFSLKARGLFLNSDNKGLDVIARSYNKFFNFGERECISFQEMEILEYPLNVYEKANGYLSLLTVDNRNNQWFFSSKSTTDGEYALHFKNMILPYINNQLKEYIIENNITIVFEVIDPVWDPHIEKYNEPQLIILDAIINNISFQKLEFNELENINSLFLENDLIRVKTFIKSLNSIKDLKLLIGDLEPDDLLDEHIEGYVIEENKLDNPYIFKLKSKWYSYWKKIRGIQNNIYSNKSKLDKSQKNKLKRMTHSKLDQILLEIFIERFNNDKEALNVIDIRQTVRKVIKK